MGLADLSIAPLSIPFRTAFKHAGADRSRTQAVLVTARSRAGAVGMGEGCPREYVTRENVDTCLAFFTAHRSEWMGFSCVDDLDGWASRNSELVDANPAAWCAVELALLDLLAREAGMSVERLLGVPELTGPFAYTAVLGDSVPEVFDAQLKRFLSVGFADFKVKAGGDPGRDGPRLQAIRAAAGPAARVRLDANNLWASAPDALAYLERLPFLPAALEEPLRAFDFAGMETLARAVPARIILDESLLTVRDLERVRGKEQFFIANLRVSKLGGLQRSLAVAGAARAMGLPIIVGAQVGETSLLTRAALTVAEAGRAVLMAQEGAYGTHLLESDITGSPLMFGKGGLLHPSAALDYSRHGFQIAYLAP